jgi:hypothetical protein
LTDAELRGFAAGGLAPEDLLRADDHLSGCDECRTRASAVNNAAMRIDDLRAELGPAAPHLSDDDLQRLVSGRLPPQTLAAIEEHLRTCRVCAAQVDDLRAWTTSVPRGRAGWLALAAAVVVAVVVPGSIWYARGVRAPGSASMAGLETLEPADQARIRAATAAGVGTLPPFMADVMPARETLMGSPVARVAAFEVIAPVQTATVSDRPRLEWRALAGADSYDVTIADEGSRVVARNSALTDTNWMPRDALARGQTYTWQVAAHLGDDTITVPAAPAPPARFHVVDAHTAEVLRLVEAEHPDSHLLIGLLDMEAGVRTEAVRHLQQVPSNDPDAGVAQRSLERLRALDTTEKR